MLSCHRIYRNVSRPQKNPKIVLFLWTTEILHIFVPKMGQCMCQLSGDMHLTYIHAFLSYLLTLQLVINALEAQ